MTAFELLYYTIFRLFKKIGIFKENCRHEWRQFSAYAVKPVQLPEPQ